VTQEIPERMPLHRIADSDLGLARQHLTAAINHSVERWRELAAAKVKHQRGDRTAARRVIRATADVVDGRLEAER